MIMRRRENNTNTLIPTLPPALHSDYEGVVQVWDVNTNTELMQFEEHARRVWSIDFSRVVSSHMLGPWQKKRNSLGIDFKHSGEYDDRPPPSCCIVQDPMRLISGGDDGTARVWSLHQERSVMTIDGRANVCRYLWSL